MFPLVETEEKSFRSLKDLSDFLADRKVCDYDVPFCELSLNKDGRLRVGRSEGQLTKSAFYGLLRICNIRWTYATKTCPTDLLVDSVQRLVRDETELHARVQFIDGVVTAIMSANQLPIRHDTLLDRLGLNCSIEEAVLTSNCLRITSITESRQLSSAGIFGFGWEIVNDENGWRPTEVWRYAVRDTLSGFLGFDQAALFSRLPHRAERVSESLSELTNILVNMPEVDRLEKAVKSAAEQKIGDEYEEIINYLAQRLEGKYTSLALASITAESSRYDLANLISSSGRTHRLAMRRRYEFEAGTLLISPAHCLFSFLGINRHAKGVFISPVSKTSV